MSWVRWNLAAAAAAVPCLECTCLRSGATEAVAWSEEVSCWAVGYAYRAKMAVAGSEEISCWTGWQAMHSSKVVRNIVVNSIAVGGSPVVCW